MAEYLNTLMKKFTNVRLLSVRSDYSEVEFVGWRKFMVYRDGRVQERTANESWDYTPASQWLCGILAGKKRDADGNLA